MIATYRLLKKTDPDPGKVRKKFGSSSDDKLIGALANPEHSAAAKTILAEMAEERGIPDSDIRGWLLLERNMYVKPFGKKPSFAEALVAPRKRRRLYRTLQMIFAGGVLLAFLAMSQEEVSDFWAMVLTLGLIGGFLVYYVGAIYSWLNPARILLLRPFQSRQLSKSLLRFNNKHLAFIGHVTTLSDKHMKESRFMFLTAWIPRSPWDILFVLFFLIPAIRQLLRWLVVSSARSYALLKNRQARRFTLNMFWVNSWNKILRVRCSDVWWKQAVDLLMYTSQLIVVDLSLVKEGTEWELEKIDRRDLEKKTVFVVSDESKEYAEKVIQKFWPADEAPPPLFVYNQNGDLQDSEGFDQSVAGIISTSHLWDSTAPAAYTRQEVKKPISTA